MKIDKDYFYVTGSYYLKTTGDTSITLVYPFPVDSMYGGVDLLRIFNLTLNEPVQPLVESNESAFFKAGFGKFKEIEVLISYRQQLPGNRAEYILESTAGWRKPLEQADYQLIVAPGLEIVSFSISPDESIITEQETVYYWTKANYLPDKNMIFEFKAKLK